jgi:hypothetical protein
MGRYRSRSGELPGSGGDAKCFIFIGRLSRLDTRANIFAPRHQAKLLKFMQRCPDGVTACGVLRAQFKFSWQQGAYWKASRNNAFGQVAGDIGEMRFIGDSVHGSNYGLEPQIDVALYVRTYHCIS